MIHVVVQMRKERERERERERENFYSYKPVGDFHVGLVDDPWSLVGAIICSHTATKGVKFRSDSFMIYGGCVDGVPTALELLATS